MMRRLTKISVFSVIVLLVACQRTDDANAVAPVAGLADELVGSWVQAERGGEDGKTKCDDAELMTTLNGGTTNQDTFYRSGKITHTLWYDVAFDQRGEPEVKAAYNQGSWTADEKKIYYTMTGGQTGLFGSDLGEYAFEATAYIKANVMMQRGNDETIRYVRCKN